MLENQLKKMRKRNRVDVTSSLYEVCRMPTPNEHNYDYGSIIKTVLLAFLVVFLLQNGNLREISGYIARTSRMLINKIEPQHFNNQPQTFREQQNLIIENQNLKEELKEKIKKLLKELEENKKKQWMT